MTAQPPERTHDQLRAELVALLFEATRRDPATAGLVTDETPCVGGDLLQDSLDVLEFVVALDRVYGVAIRDSDSGRVVLGDVGSLTRHVAANRVR